VLLEAEANPELQDKEGRDVVSLVERLRLQMPPNPGLLQRRLALEQVANVLVDRWAGGLGQDNLHPLVCLLEQTAGACRCKCRAMPRCVALCIALLHSQCAQHGFLLLIQLFSSTTAIKLAKCMTASTADLLLLPLPPGCMTRWRWSPSWRSGEGWTGRQSTWCSSRLV
jgi:hypothetical protein